MQAGDSLTLSPEQQAELRRSWSCMSDEADTGLLLDSQAGGCKRPVECASVLRRAPGRSSIASAEVDALTAPPSVTLGDRGVDFSSQQHQQQQRHAELHLSPRPHTGHPNHLKRHMSAPYPESDLHKRPALHRPVLAASQPLSTIPPNAPLLPRGTGPAPDSCAAGSIDLKTGAPQSAVRSSSAAYHGADTSRIHVHSDRTVHRAYSAHQPPVALSAAHVTSSHPLQGALVWLIPGGSDMASDRLKVFTAAVTRKGGTVVTAYSRRITHAIMSRQLFGKHNPVRALSAAVIQKSTCRVHEPEWLSDMLRIAGGANCVSAVAGLGYSLQEIAAWDHGDVGRRSLFDTQPAARALAPVVSVSPALALPASQLTAMTPPVRGYHARASLCADSPPPLETMDCSSEDELDKSQSGVLARSHAARTGPVAGAGSGTDLVAAPFDSAVFLPLDHVVPVDTTVDLHRDKFGCQPRARAHDRSTAQLLDPAVSNQGRLQSSCTPAMRPMADMPQPPAVRERSDRSGESTDAALNDHLIKHFETLEKTYTARQDPWRPRAYRRAITVLKGISEALTPSNYTAVLANHAQGLGKRTMEKIKEIMETGTLARADQLQHDPQAPVVNLFASVWGIGVTTARKLYEQGYRTLDDLRGAAPGVLNSSQRVALQYFDDLQARIPRAEVHAIELIVTERATKLLPGSVGVCCGSYRRGKHTSGDVDILITHPSDEHQTQHALLNDLLPELVLSLKASGFISHELTVPGRQQAVSARSRSEQSLSRGNHTPADGSAAAAGAAALQRSWGSHDHHAGSELGPRLFMGLCRLPDAHPSFSGLQRRLDIKVCPLAQFAFALLSFTGSDRFNRSMRLFARRKGYALSDQGLTLAVRDSKGVILSQSRSVYCADETAVFTALGLQYVAPQDRE